MAVSSASSSSASSSSSAVPRTKPGLSPDLIQAYLAEDDSTKGRRLGAMLFYHLVEPLGGLHVPGTEIRPSFQQVGVTPRKSDKKQFFQTTYSVYGLKKTWIYPDEGRYRDAIALYDLAEASPKDIQLFPSGMEHLQGGAFVSLCDESYIVIWSNAAFASDKVEKQRGAVEFWGPLPRDKIEELKLFKTFNFSHLATDISFLSGTEPPTMVTSSVSMSFSITKLFDGSTMTRRACPYNTLRMTSLARLSGEMGDSLLVQATHNNVYGFAGIIPLSTILSTLDHPEYWQVPARPAHAKKGWSTSFNATTHFFRQDISNLFFGPSQEKMKKVSLLSNIRIRKEATTLMIGGKVALLTWDATSAEAYDLISKIKLYELQHVDWDWGEEPMGVALVTACTPPKIITSTRGVHSVWNAETGERNHTFRGEDKSAYCRSLIDHLCKQVKPSEP